MAAAVMRAMTFGSSASSSSRTGSERGHSAERDAGSNSTSTSRTALSKALSLDLGTKSEDDDAALSRTSSRLTTAGSPPPAGILLNPVAQAANVQLGSSPSRSFYGSQPASDSHASSIDILSSTASTPRPTLQRLPSDTSSSYSQVRPTTPVAPSFVRPSLPVGASDQKGARQSTIRFAPLPEIRPRSYSTGRNVWIVDDDGDGDSEQRRTRLVRVGSDVEGDDDDGDLGFALDEENDEDRGGKWGSWSDTLSSGMWGLSPSTSRRSNLSTASGDEDAVSLSGSAGGGANDASASAASSKLLKAFGLGRGKGKQKKRQGGVGDADDVLARVSSGESEISRRSSVDVSSSSPAPRPRGTTGIPMRKASTWEVGDEPAPSGAKTQTGGPVYYASPARTTRRRANYPPVAQRSRYARGRGPAAVNVEEPKFSEWGGSGVGGRGCAADEEDGSGMAWLKKRRLEREKAERERAEREAQEAEARGAAGEEEEEADESEPEDDGSATPAAAAAANGFPHSLPLPSQLETFRRGRKPPSRSGTLDSTASSASTIRSPTPPSSAPPQQIVGGLSATRPALVVQVPSQPSSSTASPDGSDDEETPVTSPVGEDGDSGSDDDEEDEDEEDDEQDDDDDLDAEELAHEEALAEEARRSAKSMGAERYHSAKHENEIKVVAPTASPDIA